MGMLTILIIIEYALWFIGFFVNGITLYQVMVFFSPTLFMLRKFGIHTNAGPIIALDAFFLICSSLWKFLFGGWDTKIFLINLIIRAIAFGIVLYDDTAYVYVNEERKKQ